ncbi:MAG: cupin domain-containing protein, partial [Actinobacteria bacterium]|nr:cupin domain-containing protein [Actinomycetota bacterium]
ELYRSPSQRRCTRFVCASFCTATTLRLSPMIEPLPFRVLFEPGARTNWHTHPEGQILYVITGEGRAQKEGEPAVAIGSGDVVYFAPNEKHWHGAGPDTFMVHMAINPANTFGGGTDWMEPVTDEEYSGR